MTKNTDDVALDRTDRRILRLLQSDADISAAAIGERIGASQATVWRRIQQMRESGLIPPQVVTLDRRKAGFNAMIFAQVKLSSHGRANLAEFADTIQNFPEVLEAYVMMGSTDFLLRIVTPDIEAYERFFFEKLSQLPGVQEVTSSMALSEIKQTSVLPL
ncbi:Lrp/AsnC family transcriptional regulator [Elongatibacter sediminis]|uniref:Lrp/AsnC family transcriptional regulator n=1 Tax=Elongatibacter sediminis TaxID=3119006 RepID=A0AAW9RAG3_9GAMM